MAVRVFHKKPRFNRKIQSKKKSLGSPRLCF
jgi:hypothetical protein